MRIKKEYRILGIDDGHFSKDDKSVIVIGTVFRGGEWMDGIITTEIEVDGNNATQKLIELVKKTKHSGQLRCIMLKGISLGGFNVIDIQELSRKTKLPVIVVVRKKPDFKKINLALKNVNDTEQKMKRITRAGEVYPVKIKDKQIYFQISNITKENAEKIIKMSATHSLVPEPLRAAHLIASGVTTGESKRRA